MPLPSGFYGRLLNSQPMVFTPGPSSVRDARRHGVEVLPVDVGSAIGTHTRRRGKAEGGRGTSKFGKCELRNEKKELRFDHETTSPPSASPSAFPSRLASTCFGRSVVDVERIVEARRKGVLPRLDDFARRKPG